MTARLTSHLREIYDPCHHTEVQGDPKKMQPTKLFVESLKLLINSIFGVLSLDLCLISPPSFNFKSVEKPLSEAILKKNSKIRFRQKSLLNCSIKDQQASYNFILLPRRCLKFVFTALVLPFLFLPSLNEAPAGIIA